MCIKRSGSDPEKLINDHDILYKYRQNIYLIREWVVSVCVGVGGWGGGGGMKYRQNAYSIRQ